MKKILFLIALLPFIATAQTSTPPVNYVISYPADTTVNFYNWSRTQHYVDSACTTFANSLAIGNPIIGGTTHGILSEDANGNLYNDGNLIYDPSAHQFTVSDGTVNFIDFNNNVSQTNNGNIFGYNQDGQNFITVGAVNNGVYTYYEDNGASVDRYIYQQVGSAYIEVRSDDNGDFAYWQTAYMPFLGSDGNDHTAYFGNNDFGAYLNYNDDLHMFEFTNADSVNFDHDVNVYGGINMRNGGNLFQFDGDGNIVTAITPTEIYTGNADGSDFAYIAPNLLAIGHSGGTALINAEMVSGFSNIFNLPSGGGTFAMLENYSSGSAALDGGTVSISDPNIKANSIIVAVAAGSPLGGIEIAVESITEGVGFTISSSGGLDSRTVNYFISYN